MRRLNEPVINGHTLTDKRLSYKPLDFGGEVIELPQEDFACAPTRQIIVTPIGDQFLQIVAIEAILKGHAFERRRQT